MTMPRNVYGALIFEVEPEDCDVWQRRDMTRPVNKPLEYKLCAPHVEALKLRVQDVVHDVMTLGQ